MMIRKLAMAIGLGLHMKKIRGDERGNRDR